MAWATPRTWTTGEVPTAAMMNQDVRDNMLDLDRRTSWTSAQLASTQSTTSTTFTDLATAGPAITLTVGVPGRLLVWVSCHSFNSTAGNKAAMAFALTGANTRSAFESEGTVVQGTQPVQAANLQVVVALNTGSTTATAKYRASATTAEFAERRIGGTTL